MVEPHIIREKTSTLGEITIPKQCVSHMNVSILRKLVEAATLAGEGHLIPAGELPEGVINRVRNVHSTEELVKLINERPGRTRTGW